MRKIPRDLPLILRTEARNQRTPPIDYVIAEDGGRMVHRPEPDVAMAELLDDAATEIARLREALEPFGRVAGLFEHLDDDGGSVMVNVPLSSLRNARALSRRATGGE